MTDTVSYAIGPSEPELRDVTVGDLLAEAAAAVPDRTALIEGLPDRDARRSWTYQELYDESVRVARALTQRFEPGERVAVWAPNIPEWILLEFGCALAGVTLVTINPALREHEVQYVLCQSRSAGMFVMNEFRGSPMRAIADQVHPSCPDLREVISFDDWADFVAAGHDPAVTLPAVAPNDSMMIQYTSGTTGFPKGALLHHRGLANNGAHVADRMGMREESVAIAVMPLFHTGGSVLTVLGAVSTHSTLVLVQAFEPGLVLELFDTYRGTAMMGVPTMLIALLEHPRFAEVDLSSIEAIVSGGSLVPEELVRRFEAELGAPFTIVFGQTECSPVASMTQTFDSLTDKAQTIGPPMPHVEVKVIDPDTGETLPMGSVGEYCTRGYHVMSSYFDMPEHTNEAIDADGWLHTGDLCAMDERGYCTVEGRLKDMIIRGGENIYPKEIEELLFEHPTVGEVAVVGIPDDKWGETVAAFVRPAAGATVDQRELFAYVRERLAPHKTPKDWIVVEDFPFTGSGKIQKFRLREMWEAGDFSSSTDC